jgi:hypothetical protein
VTRSRALAADLPLWARKKLVFLTSIVIVSSAVSCGGRDQPQVVRVAAFPWPEGPGLVVAAATPTSGIYVPLRDVEGAIPSTLPKNPMQSCGYGAKVQITLRTGGVLTYGPCRRPALIERLRLALLQASRKQ